MQTVGISMSNVKTMPPAAVRSVRRSRPSREEAEQAVATLLAWSGDDVDREGLRDTPRRVVEAYEEYFRGYREDPLAWLEDDDTDMARGYDDMIMLRGVHLQSFCEHHLTPFEGHVHVAYVPGRRLVGLSRLVRVIETLARRLQTQEALTEQVVGCLEEGLKPEGIAIVMEAEHQCMSLRGVRQRGVKTLTTRFTGVFDTDASLRSRFIALTLERPDR
jgi:GTP cyclohydrolase IA